MSAKTNILILFTDEQRYDTIARGGYPHMITPNLDRLAAEGVIYRNAHTPSPICQPARHDLITGLTARAHGYYSNSKLPIKDYGIPTLPRIFSENDYRTAAIGKMHFTPSRMHHGFDEMFLMEELPKNRQDDQYATYLKEKGLEDLQNIHGIRPLLYLVPQYSQMDEAHHGNTWVADKTIDWLKENGDNPFLLFSSWISPHPPFTLPESYQGLYSDREIPEPIPVSRMDSCPAEGSDLYGDNESDEVIRKMREAYYSSITMVDKNIGRILDYLTETEQIDNTLIIFTSDHGEMLYDKGYYKKALPYEGSVRIPFIIRYPERFPQDVIKEEFVDLHDIFPTCLDVAGLEYEDDKYQLPGESLCSQHFHRDREKQISSLRNWVMNRNKRYKYVYRYHGGKEGFYDLKNDPQEIINLIETGDYPKDIYRELKAGAIDHEKKWGLKGRIKNNDFIKIEDHKNSVTIGTKYAKGLNNHFQSFYEKNPEGRAEQFIREARHALKDQRLSGMRLKEIYNGREFIHDFMEKWGNYATGNEIKDILFNIK